MLRTQTLPALSRQPRFSGQQVEDGARELGVGGRSPAPAERVERGPSLIASTGRPTVSPSAAPAPQVEAAVCNLARRTGDQPASSSR